jgi:hypothetical protein
MKLRVPQQEVWCRPPLIVPQDKALAMNSVAGGHVLPFILHNLQIFYHQILADNLSITR